MLTSANTSQDNRIIYSILILAFYFIGQFGGPYIYPYYRYLLADFSPIVREVAWSITYFGIVPLIGTLLIFGSHNFWGRLGLDKGFGKGLGIAFIVTLPMLIGYAWLADFTVNIDRDSDFIFGTLTAPFFEELFFRAFLFGLLYRYAGWNLWAATLLDGLVFGAIHIGQGDSLMSATAVFAVTGAGAIGFSILYKEWEWNLWLVIFLHAFMNFYWMAFDVADNAAGGMWANVFRITTVVIAIGWTVYHVRQQRALKQEEDLPENSIVTGAVSVPG